MATLTPEFVLVGTQITSPGTGFNSERFGGAATAENGATAVGAGAVGGEFSVAVGSFASTGTGSHNVAVGRTASIVSPSMFCVAIGHQAAITTSGTAIRADQAVVIGQSASIDLPSGASSSSVCIGYSAEVGNAHAVAIGYNVNSGTGLYNTVVGSNSTCGSGVKSTALGNQATCGDNSNATAVGQIAKALKTSDTVVGASAASSSGGNGRETVIGESALATLRSLVTVVDFSLGAGDTISLTVAGVLTVLTEGADFNAVTNNDTTAGNIQVAANAVAGVTATVVGAVVILEADMTAIATSDAAAWTAAITDANGNNVVMGTDAKVVGMQSVTIGSGAIGGHNESVAVGHLAKTDGSSCVVVGARAEALGTNNGIAVGQQASSTLGGICIGQLSAAAGGIAIGQNSDSTGQAIAIGTGVQAIGGVSVAIGSNASFDNVVVGQGCSDGAALQATVVGRAASVTGNAGTVLGNAATAGGNAAALGHLASASFSSSLALGARSTATAVNQLVIGDVNSPITTAFVGEGVTSASPQALSLNATGGSGTDIASGAFQIAGGRSTGNAVAGILEFQTGTPGGSGTTAQTLATRLTISDTAATFTVPVTAPGLGAADSANSILAGQVFG